MLWNFKKREHGKQQRKFSFPPSKFIYFLAKYIVSTPRLKENHLRYKKLLWKVIKLSRTSRMFLPHCLSKRTIKCTHSIRPCKQKPHALPRWLDREIKEALIENQRLTQTILQLKQNLNLSKHKGNSTRKFFHSLVKRPHDAAYEPGAMPSIRLFWPHRKLWGR